MFEDRTGVPPSDLVRSIVMNLPGRVHSVGSRDDGRSPLGGGRGPWREPVHTTLDERETLNGCMGPDPPRVRAYVSGRPGDS